MTTAAKANPLDEFLAGLDRGEEDSDIPELTAEEIRERAAEVRAGWDQETERKRRVGPP